MNRLYSELACLDRERCCGQATHSVEAVDYPDFAAAVGQAVARGEAWRGIVLDSAGIGSAIAANKVPGVRAALCYDRATGRAAPAPRG